MMGQHPATEQWFYQALGPPVRNSGCNFLALCLLVTDDFCRRVSVVVGRSWRDWQRLKHN